MMSNYGSYEDSMRIYRFLERRELCKWYNVIKLLIINWTLIRATKLINPLWNLELELKNPIRITTKAIGVLYIPFRELPLYINYCDPGVAEIAVWRLRNKK